MAYVARSTGASGRYVPRIKFQSPNTQIEDAFNIGLQGMDGYVDGCKPSLGGCFPGLFRILEGRIGFPGCSLFVKNINLKLFHEQGGGISAAQGVYSDVTHMNKNLILIAACVGPGPFQRFNPPEKLFRDPLTSATPTWAREYSGFNERARSNSLWASPDRP